jgi:hypothetical protein
VLPRVWFQLVEGVEEGLKIWGHGLPLVTVWGLGSGPLVGLSCSSAI